MWGIKETPCYSCAPRDTVRFTQLKIVITLNKFCLRNNMSFLLHLLVFSCLIINLCFGSESTGVPSGATFDESQLGDLKNIDLSSFGANGGSFADESEAVVDNITPAPSPELSNDDETAIQKTSESYEFQTEVSRLMDIIINSLYSQKDVFLRELLSNSADALEKARFISVTDDSFLGEQQELEIRVSFNNDKRTITISDTGIGMTRHDLVTNLGTVAKSGTANFLESLAKGGDLNLIGQFGVGFYASYLVSDRVTVISKNNEDKQYVWESSADGSFRVSLDPRGNTIKRGTTIVLSLKEDATEFMNFSKLKDLVLRYSQFINFPIYIYNPEGVNKSEKDESGEKKESKGRWEQVNVEKAIWLRPKEEITKEEYNGFYKSITHDYSEPLRYLHFSAEGEIEFKSLLFIPSHPPFDMFDTYMGKSGNIKFYVRRVLITDHIEDLLPKYLNFIKGVVDSDDISLNVAREHVQQSRIIKVISKKMVRKVLEMIKQIQTEQLNAEKEEANKPDEEKKKDAALTVYDKFYDMFHKNLKLGCYEDDSNRSKIIKLLKFHTSKSGDSTVFLSKYIEGMKPEQKSIFYISGESPAALLKNPLVSLYLKHDIEVLFLTEGVDEPCISRVPELEGFKFTSIEKSDVRPFEETEEEKNMHKRLSKFYEPLLKFVKDEFPGEFLKVEVSKRLVSDPAVITSGPWGQSAYMQKIQKAQTFSNKADYKNKHMEINPNHALIKKLNDLVISKNNVEAKALALKIIQLSTIASGFDLENPSEFASGMFKIMLQSSGIDEKDVISSVELPEEVSTDEGVEDSDQEKGFDDEEDEKNEKRDEL
ncbi:Hsp90 family protein [Cryptosporidium hominis]|nr:heat shock protein 90 [Cryptosporidium hominis TU502]OLQ18031.1 Heat shock protein HSP 90-alpha [Cryptosporidium hominis]PPA62993.1 Hsp90 family protein [Cryptosporidium hominis]